MGDPLRGIWACLRYYLTYVKGVLQYNKKWFGSTLTISMSPLSRPIVLLEKEPVHLGRGITTTKKGGHVS